MHFKMSWMWPYDRSHYTHSSMCLLLYFGLFNFIYLFFIFMNSYDVKREWVCGLALGGYAVILTFFGQPKLETAAPSPATLRFPFLSPLLRFHSLLLTSPAFPCTSCLSYLFWSDAETPFKKLLIHFDPQNYIILI